MVELVVGAAFVNRIDSHDTVEAVVHGPRRSCGRRSPRPGRVVWHELRSGRQWGRYPRVAWSGCILDGSFRLRDEDDDADGGLGASSHLRSRGCGNYRE
ncbi:MAG: hypothetical protein OEV40_06410 [Acidimicrobiia bacterium]|nr:hypothetical protein [Acidimicrobiia bacterium]